MGGRTGLCRRAFTLVELLVTATVLAIVLAVAAQAVQWIRDEGRKGFTQDLLGQIAGALRRYHDERGAYPPDRFTPDRVSPLAGSHDPRTEGVECLVAALSAGPEAPFWRQGRFERAWANTDGDRNRFDNQPLFELVDGWGRPLLYYHGCGAGPVETSGRPLAPFAGMAPVQMARLNGLLSDRWIHQSRRPLVDSAGPDGIFGNSDDQQQAEWND